MALCLLRERLSTLTMVPDHKPTCKHLHTSTVLKHQETLQCRHEPALHSTDVLQKYCAETACPSACRLSSHLDERVIVASKSCTRVDDHTLQLILVVARVVRGRGGRGA